MQTTDESFEGNRNSKTGKGLFWNVLTILLLLCIAIMVWVFFLIYKNPNIPLNPFKPPSLPAVLIANSLATTTELSVVPVTLTIFPPTWTPTVTLVPSLTFTPRAVTVESTQTPISLTPATKTSTPTERPDMPFVILGTPVAMVSTDFRPGSDCKWMGVAGKVIDMQNAPIVGTTIHLGGTLSLNFVDLLSLTGTSLQYGTSGYEFTLTDIPIASQQSLWVQLLDQAGLPLSNRVYFDTYNDCQKNLILITFKQVR